MPLERNAVVISLSLMRVGLRNRAGYAALPARHAARWRYISTKDLPSSVAPPTETFADSSADVVMSTAREADIPDHSRSAITDSLEDPPPPDATFSDANVDAVTSVAKEARIKSASQDLSGSSSSPSPSASQASPASSNRSSQTSSPAFRPRPGEAGLRLPAAFGQNQSLSVPDERRKLLEKIVGNFSAVRWAVAYGSGIFEQAGYETEKKAPMLDFIFATSHPSHFHAVNLNRHPSHYPLLARWLGVDYITRIQNAGAGVWYATMIDMEDHMIKYGVISIDSLCEDLMDWKTLYVGGRMMKPVRMVRRDQRVVLANQVNLVSALRVALLSLPEEFTERELWEKIAGISYAGDPRMQMGGENPNKVANIVAPQIPRFRELYFKLLSAVGGVRAKHASAVTPRQGLAVAEEKDEAVWRAMGMGEPGGKGLMLQNNDPEHRADLLKRLPRTLKSALEARYTGKLNVKVVRPSDAEEVKEKLDAGEDGFLSETDFWLRVAQEEDLRETIDQELRNIVRSPAIAQTFKGLFTAGFRKSVTYAGRKVAKWWKGQPAGSTK